MNIDVKVLFQSLALAIGIVLAIAGCITGVVVINHEFGEGVAAGSVFGSFFFMFIWAAIYAKMKGYWTWY